MIKLDLRNNMLTGNNLLSYAPNEHSARRSSPPHSSQRYAQLCLRTTGPLPKSVVQMERLRTLDLSQNDLTGWVPEELGCAKLSCPLTPLSLA